MYIFQILAFGEMNGVSSLERSQKGPTKVRIASGFLPESVEDHHHWLSQWNPLNFKG